MVQIRLTGFPCFSLRLDIHGPGWSSWIVIPGPTSIPLVPSFFPLPGEPQDRGVAEGQEECSGRDRGKGRKTKNKDGGSESKGNEPIICVPSQVHNQPCLSLRRGHGRGFRTTEAFLHWAMWPGSFIWICVEIREVRTKVNFLTCWHLRVCT